MPSSNDFVGKSWLYQEDVPDAVSEVNLQFRFWSYKSYYLIIMWMFEKLIS